MTTATPKPIRTIHTLIERLEEIHADLDPRNLTTLRQYEHVGWARRSVASLLEQCRQEAESMRLAEQQFARVLPKGARL